jgi:hypothetical protein
MRGLPRLKVRILVFPADNDRSQLWTITYILQSVQYPRLRREKHGPPRLQFLRTGRCLHRLFQVVSLMIMSPYILS